MTSYRAYIEKAYDTIHHHHASVSKTLHGYGFAAKVEHVLPRQMQPDNQCVVCGRIGTKFHVKTEINRDVTVAYAIFEWPLLLIIQAVQRNTLYVRVNSCAI